MGLPCIYHVYAADRDGTVFFGVVQDGVRICQIALPDELTESLINHLKYALSHAQQHRLLKK